jgi:RNA polymerase-binding transcription factor DksA
MPTSENAAKEVEAMSKKLLQHFEKRLMEERRRAVKELGNYGEAFGATSQESDGDLSSYSFHMADQGTDAMEREKAFSSRARRGASSGTSTRRCGVSIGRPETFGKCHNCGNDIAFERLDALPHARYCIQCKQREEDAKSK